MMWTALVKLFTFSPELWRAAPAVGSTWVDPAE